MVYIYDKELRLYDTALATIVAQIDDDGIPRGPSSVPSLFSTVETLTSLDLKQLNLDTGDIPIGYVRTGHKASEVIVSLRGDKVIPHHILVSGVTGSGKSNLGKVLAYSIMKIREPKYSLIIFDCESEYFAGSSPTSFGLAHLPEAEERLLYITEEVNEFARTEFKFEFEDYEITRIILTHPLEIDLTKLHPYDFILTGEFSSPQEELLWIAYKIIGEEWLKFLIETNSSTIYSRLSRVVHKNTINTAKRKLKYLLGNGYIFKEEVESDLINIVLEAVKAGKVILFDIPHATEGEEKLLTTLIARRIFTLYEKTRKREPNEWESYPYVLIMVEEAHKYLSRTALTTVRGELRENIFSIISKRGRKYKVGAMYITQMPGELIEPVIRQSITKIILPLPTKPDYIKIIQYSPFLEDAEQEIKTLDRGEALIVSPISGLRFAVPVKIFSFDELVREELKEEIKVHEGVITF